MSPSISKLNGEVTFVRSRWKPHQSVKGNCILDLDSFAVKKHSIKESFNQKLKFSHYLQTPIMMES